MDLRTLTCQMAHFQSNGRDVVGRGWGVSNSNSSARPLQLDLISLCPSNPLRHRMLPSELGGV